MATALTRYTPTNGVGFTRLPDVIGRLFDESFVMPSVLDRSFRQVLGSNLYETNEEFVIQVALPGIDADKLDIQVTGPQIVIKGQYNLPAPENAVPVWQGIAGGQFVETMTLPGEVNSANAEAHYEGGVLTLTLPKAEHIKAKSIKVNVAR